MLNLLREKPDNTTDHENVAADLRDFDRLLKSVLAADFDDVVDAAAGPISPRPFPIR